MDMTDAPNPSGTNEPQATAEDVREFMEAGIPYGSGELAEVMDLARRTTTYRLNKIDEQGAIESKMIGTSKVWYIPCDG